MKKYIKILVISILLIGLLINNVCAVCEWGVDENGKFSYKYIMVVVKEEYTDEPENVIAHIESTLDVDGVKILSVTEEYGPPLILLIYLPVLSEEYFYSIYNALSQDPYVEFAFKEYHIGPDKSYLGDVNQDGKIQTDDARTILMYAAGHNEPKTTTEKMLADADRDGVITTQDARYALSVACGIL